MFSPSQLAYFQLEILFGPVALSSSFFFFFPIGGRFVDSIKKIIFFDFYLSMCLFITG